MKIPRFDDKIENIYKDLTERQKGGYRNKHDEYYGRLNMSGILIVIVTAITATAFVILAFIEGQYGVLFAAGFFICLFIIALWLTLSSAKMLKWTDEAKIKYQIKLSEKRKMTSNQEVKKTSAESRVDYFLLRDKTNIGHGFRSGRTGTSFSDDFPWLSGKSDHLSFDEIIDIGELLDD